MKVEKEKRRIQIACNDGASIKGVIHINPGERVSDYLNDAREQFLVITNAEFYFTEDVQSFKLASKLTARKEVVFLNKVAIKLAEEI
ncbi:MAG TPA: hypothetical protein PKL77_00655 [Candidatus Omnitrophota bacterium]|nr:hypothetical protein [Candidatus Omnitrophota bacterium]HPT06567.1 hypothetical protein [Candidatus Omnitrophota bacterium]